MTDNQIQEWIQSNMFHEDGTPMIDVQCFYEGAKWFRNKYLNDLKKELERRLSIIESETDDLTRDLMISILTKDLIDN